MRTCLLCQEGWAQTTATAAPAPPPRRKLSLEHPLSPSPRGNGLGQELPPNLLPSPRACDFLTGYSPKDKQILPSK